MIVYGPGNLRNTKKEKLEKCINEINFQISLSYGPKVKIDLDSLELPYKGIEWDLIQLYKKHGWFDVNIEEQCIEGPEAEEYLHPPYRMHMILISHIN